jgi:hypothetical protein
MYKSSLHLSANIIGFTLFATAILSVQLATAESLVNPTKAPSTVKVTEPRTIVPITSPLTPTQQIDIINTQSKPISSPPQNSSPQNSPPQNSPPQNSSPQNSPPQNSLPQNNPPVATGDNSVPIPPMATSTIPQSRQIVPNLVASPKLQRGQMNVGNYIFSPASAASTVRDREIELPSTASSRPNNHPDSTTSSNEVAKKTASPELQIQARLNTAQIAYDRAAVKLAELQTATPGTNPNPALIAAQIAERDAATELDRVQSQARQLLENIKNRP